LLCMLQPANVEFCEPLLQEVRASWPTMPASSESFRASCGAGPATSEGEASALSKALSARAAAASRGGTGVVAGGHMLELAMAGKQADSRCAQAPEGQTCIANPSGGHSDHYIYCSNHKRLSSGATSCASKRGRMSWCVGGGVGLTHDCCDDPFCRNGGAYGGDGLYCHMNNVVHCAGQNAPSVVEACTSRSYSDGFGCTTTDHYSCQGYYPQPYCALSYRSTECSGGNGYGPYYR